MKSDALGRFNKNAIYFACVKTKPVLKMADLEVFYCFDT